ncbi:hypothetical protein [Hyphomonas sp. UBA4494]|jgi:hypothetical protein|uniref:hypothetical protein n=1 Tax=Hyphomonas sp. UBA4494 TaxID=1946631 RepID=UPI0025BF3C43|nr:hypothetical protein [Hyphomonas sp. UBA4494]
MGTTITVTNRGDKDYAATCTSAAAADPTGDIEIAVTEGITGLEIITALEKAKQYVAQTIRNGAAAAAP